MDVRWFEDLQSPQQPGIYRLSNGKDQVLVSQSDIDRIRKLNAFEIRCSCVPHVTDAEGNPVMQILRFCPLPNPANDPLTEGLRVQRGC